MAFPSPAKDYAEARLNINTLCHIDANCSVVETTSGYAVVNKSLRAEQGNVVFITYCGRSQFAKLMGKSLITSDGDALEGECLDDVVVAGVITYEIKVVHRKESDDYPVI